MSVNRIYPLLVTSVLLLVALTKNVDACSCTPEASAPACQLISRTQVVFLGQCIGLVGEPGYGNYKLYRFRVDKAYKGLAKDTVEVMVHSGAGTSCETTYTVGTNYIMFATVASREPLQLSAWMCSGSRDAETNKADVEFLNQYAQGKTATTVFGKVLQWVTYIGLPQDEESAPLAGVKVELEKGSERFIALTKPDGSFSFSDIPAGEYQLTAKLAPYTSPPPYKILVGQGACNQVFVQLRANASIAGILRTPDGKPAAKQRVEVLRKQRDGKWYSTYQMWTQTDEQGAFHFKDLESGEYLLGYEIRGSGPSYYTPYPTQYYPNVADRSQAKVITLAPQQHLKGLDITLPPPHTNRMITIRVVWPDGRPMGENLLQVSARSGFLKNLRGSTHQGVVRFEGFQEREYEFIAEYWIDDLGNNNSVPHEEKRIAKSDRVKLPSGKESAEIVLVLKHEMRVKDER